MAAGFVDKFKTAIGLDLYEDEVDEAEDFAQPVATAEPGKFPQRNGRPGTTGSSVSGRPNNNISILPTSTNSEVVVIEPRSFDEALGILDNLRTRKAVILNLLGLAPDQSQRLVDFVSGACHALDGHQEKIGESIFLFTPSNVVINTFHSDRDWMGNQQPKDLFWRVGTR